ncbi:YjjG family noncanonical pyrimidine nucleotidase [Piscirickettsia litoralis]|uniref:Noncanonical pyrimidine nucleotidase, YjjG family n=1 Tax=Piscirickettsia litoralis TaxID=1891921 RepID=A0ABX3A4D0_9GAMM|nr:YjjG family noncanonical pyrimidine nucleotidase [Piscirickettsia litoralis]ODN43102.1 noncanonical pyrimidine nucleotidase, YjjG family [Piscirickettsia litoralis]
MKQYRCLIFDLDDTLYNFAYGQSVALEMLYAEYFPELDDYSFFKERYAVINRSYWQQVEAGKISVGQLSALRFAAIKAEFATQVSVDDLVESYRRVSCTQRAWCQGAEQAIALLTKQFDCALLSNGTLKDQQAKLHALGLTDVFKPVVLSDELGVSKPNQKIFQPIFNELNVEPKHCLLIGDSLTSDYQAALNVGMDFCWFNEKKISRGDYPLPLVEIDDLMELVRYLRIIKASDGRFKDELC